MYQPPKADCGLSSKLCIHSYHVGTLKSARVSPVSVSSFFFEEHIPGGLCAATELCDVLKMLCGRSWHVRAGKTTRLSPVRAVKFLLPHTGESMIVRRLR